MSDGSRTSAVKAGAWAFYAGTVLLAGAGFWAVQRAGVHLAPPDVQAAAHAATRRQPGGGVPLLDILLALAVIVVAARAVGWLFRRLGQPPVVGEVVAGICLGPSLLGRFAPAAQAFLLPPDTAPYLGALAQFGVILFMFVVGLELDPLLLRKRTQATVAVSHASIVVPFVLGSTAALWLYPRFGTEAVSFPVFALFAGVSVSVTAFPVLARILTDRGIHKSSLGVVALACAAVDDVTAWCLLALITGVAHSELGAAIRTTVLSLVFIAAMLLVVRPLVVRAVRTQELRGEAGPGAIALVLVGLLASALATEWIGTHAIFGGFLLGAIIPHDSKLAAKLVTRLEDFVVVLLLPAYFALTGMRTQIGLLGTWQAWATCAGIIAIASAGKLGGSYIAGRVVGMPAREALSVGILMNTRGLMELVVLNLGLDLGIISPALFAMMVVMALVTTFATTPLLSLVTRGDPSLVGEATRSP